MATAVRSCERQQFTGDFDNVRRVEERWAPGPAGECIEERDRWRTTRRMLMEFMRTYPSTMPRAAVLLERIDDGEVVTITRAAVDAAVARLTPREHRLMLGASQRINRERICHALGISLKTYERVYRAALDRLLTLLYL